MNLTNDEKIALRVYGVYGHLPRNEAVRRVMSEMRYTWGGVSSMASRGIKRPNGFTAVQKYRTENFQTVSENARQITTIIEDSKERLASHQQESYRNERQYAVFLSDIHFPKHDVNALNLVYQVLSDIGEHVYYISSDNDALDFSKISQWEDRRKLRDQLIDADISTQIQLFLDHTRYLSYLSPNAYQVAIYSNHFLRLASYGVDSGVNALLMSEVVSDMHTAGIHFLSYPNRENCFFPHHNLVWSHGWKANANRVNNLKANYDIMQRETGVTTTPHFVMGHTHESAYTKVLGAELYNSGCLCDLQPDYMRYLPKWNQGFVISEFNPMSDYVYTHQLLFSRYGDTLMTQFNGKQYTTQIQ